MKPTWGKVVSAAWICLVVGSAVADVGRPKSVGVWEWWTPLSVFVVLGHTWLLGYWSRKGDA
jgi:hypothetical protein